MKLSEVSLAEVKEYIRETGDSFDSLITNIISAARGYILSYTGLSAEEADGIPELCIALKCLCADMYDARTASVSAEKKNPIVWAILDMHRRNLIG